MMQTFVRPSRDLRNHYAEIADMTKNHNHVIITNQGRGESVLINIEDYAKYEEFLHQRYVAEELAKAKQQAADPNTQWQDHDRDRKSTRLNSSHNNQSRMPSSA